MRERDDFSIAKCRLLHSIRRGRNIFFIVAYDVNHYLLPGSSYIRLSEYNIVVNHAKRGKNAQTNIFVSRFNDRCNNYNNSLYIPIRSLARFAIPGIPGQTISE